MSTLRPLPSPSDRRHDASRVLRPGQLRPIERRDRSDWIHAHRYHLAAAFLLVLTAAALVVR